MNYKEMSNSEIKAYILSHRDDDEAFDEYRSRLKPSGNTYSFPKTEEGLKEMELVFRQKIQEIENRRDAAS